MARFWLHIPAFVETTLAPGILEFTTTEELINLPPVKSFTEREGFSHFAKDGEMLICICDDGFFWWPVGSVSDWANVDLPDWDGWKFRARLPDGTEAVLGKEVVSSCGKVLTLKDGTKAVEIAKFTNSVDG